MANSLDSQFDDFFGGEGGYFGTEAEAFTESNLFLNPQLELLRDPTSALFEYEYTPASFGQDDSEIFGLAESDYDSRIDYGGRNPFSEIKEEDTRSLAAQGRDFVFDKLKVPASIAKGLTDFARAAKTGMAQQRAGASGRGAVDPRQFTVAPRQTSRAERTTPAARVDTRELQRAISQSNRSISMARRIQQQEAARGVRFSNNDLAELIAGEGKPKGPTQTLATSLRQLQIPRS